MVEMWAVRFTEENRAAHRVANDLEANLVMGNMEWTMHRGRVMRVWGFLLKTPRLIITSCAQTPASCKGRDTQISDTHSNKEYNVYSYCRKDG